MKYSLGVVYLLTNINNSVSLISSNGLLKSRNINIINRKRERTNNININHYSLSKIIMNSGEMDSLTPSELIKELAKYTPEPGTKWTYQTFLDNLKTDNVDQVSIFSNEKAFAVIDKSHDKTEILSDNVHIVQTLPNMIDDLIKQLNMNHINYDVYNLPEKTSGPLDLILLPLQFIGFYLIATIVLNIIINLIRNNGNSGMGGMNGMSGQNQNQFNPFNPFGQESNLIDTEGINVTFADVAGCDEAKYELEETVDFLKNPFKYQEVGAKIPKGILLEGEPGTGKTLLARAVAGEAGVSFLSASGSEFIEMFVGVGAQRVRKLFETAKQNSPCVIFIDEIDAVGRQRGAGVNTGNDEREQTLNQILTNMDGFTPTDGVIVMAATNRADILDSALLRPGRFDRKVNVPLPDTEGRKEIFGVHTRNKALANDTDINEIGVLTGGFSGADLANLANEAAILTARANATIISRKTLLDAYEKITIGLPSTKNTNDKEVLSLVSHHEIGHAMMVKYFEEFFDLRKVTINANKGGAGGYTLFTPKDFYTKYPTKKFMLANMVTALGGRAAEVKLYENNEKKSTDVVFKGIDNLDITTGASNDLKQADRLARQYITLFGCSDNDFDYNSLQSDTSQPFLGRELGMGGDKTSEYSKQLVDKKVSLLINNAYNIALKLIESNKETFYELGDKLITNRVLNGSDFNDINLVYN